MPHRHRKSPSKSVYNFGVILQLQTLNIAQFSPQSGILTNNNEKSTRRRRKHCVLTPFPGVRDGQNLISWRWSLPAPTNPVWWGSMYAISSYRGNRPTNTHTQTNTQTGAITIHCIAASTQCKNTLLSKVHITDHWEQICITDEPQSVGRLDREQSSVDICEERTERPFVQKLSTVKTFAADNIHITI